MVCTVLVFFRVFGNNYSYFNFNSDLPAMSYQFIQLTLQSHIRDTKGEHVQKNAEDFLEIETGTVKSSKVFAVDYPLTDSEVRDFAEKCLTDEIMNETFIGELWSGQEFQSYIAIAKLPGVTDDEGTSAQKALVDFQNLDLDTNTQHIYSQDLYYIEKALTEEELQQIAADLLGNKLIHHFQYGKIEVGNEALQPSDLYVPKVQIAADATTHTIDLDLSDSELLDLSKRMVLALNLEEMKAIQDHYNSPKTQAIRKELGLPLQPTDCELEVLAQTWSEHCKHKEFNAVIEYINHETGETKTIKSLFKTFIKGATDKVAESLAAKNNNWLVKVFTDNAGVVKVNEDTHLVFKVETHNSPSALDPYGGAITGILGNNRDPLGTGVGGAKLLFNTNVLCFGPPDFDGQLLTGQLHPKRIFAGVRSGIEDGGNKSGVPTVNGSIVFDDRYRGKPLVYCGTGALMPPQYKGKNSWEKPIDEGDRILVIGGRVGKDGIHGATFSSVEIDEHSPMSAVQIGSPITQKLASDFLERACRAGLVKCSTDNGAGGLSSSIGEMADLCGGAVVELEKVPLKYSGLKPWEIFVSESQERMSLVVEPKDLEVIHIMAAEMEVEMTDIGYFTKNGYLDVRYNGEKVAYLNMEFLHDGVPIKHMTAEWKKPDLYEPSIAMNMMVSSPSMPAYNDVLLALMSSFNICSRENVIRQYDHEVKGKTVIKPLMGRNGKAPQDAAVMRVGFDSFEGIAVSNGIVPKYGDIDAYEMSAGAFDEAVRQIISVGGQLPNQGENDGVFWSINDNFCVPDSDFHPETNPDGKEKLAKLVQMCEALYDMATYFDIPLTSGKDSMKNDYKGDGVKISIPPTILYSMSAKVPDFRKTVTSDFKKAGDLVYQLGKTYNELGASEFYNLFDELGANVPKVRKTDAKRLYLKVIKANEKGLIASSHDLSDGGLAVAVVESAFGGDLGVELQLQRLKGDENLDLNAILFSESHSRFVVSVAPEHRADFEGIFGADAALIGEVKADKNVVFDFGEERVVNLPVEALLEAWSGGLVEV